MVEHCHGIYNFIYKNVWKMKVEMQPRGAAIYKKVKENPGKEQPDVIVCTHPMCVRQLHHIKKRLDFRHRWLHVLQISACIRNGKQIRQICIWHLLGRFKGASDL